MNLSRIVKLESAPQLPCHVRLIHASAQRPSNKNPLLRLGLVQAHTARMQCRHTVQAHSACTHCTHTLQGTSTDRSLSWLLVSCPVRCKESFLSHMFVMSLPQVSRSGQPASSYSQWLTLPPLVLEALLTIRPKCFIQDQQGSTILETSWKVQLGDHHPSPGYLMRA